MTYLDAFSRLFSSRSTAARKKPARLSLSSRTASIRASVPSTSRAGICSSLICFLPMTAKYLISPIDASLVSDIIYSSDRR